MRELVRQPMKRVVLRSRITAPYWPSLVLQGTWLSVESPAWDKPAPALSIGKRVGIRPYCMISAAESVVKGTIPDYSIAVGSPARVVGEVEGVDAGAAPVTERLF
jgi:hypothetical protein